MIGNIVIGVTDVFLSSWFIERVLFPFKGGVPLQFGGSCCDPLLFLEFVVFIVTVFRVFGGNEDVVIVVMVVVVVTGCCPESGRIVLMYSDSMFRFSERPCLR